MFKRPTSDIHFIAVTFVLVLLMGARTFVSLTDEDEQGSEEVALAASTHGVTGARAPASVPASATKPKLGSALEQFTQVDLNCTKKSTKAVSIQGNYVQFQGRSCLKGLEVEIVNKSNGYTASIFARGTDKYQTDLIQLQSGENEIAIRYRERSGKSFEEVIKVRSTKI